MRKSWLTGGLLRHENIKYKQRVVYFGCALFCCHNAQIIRSNARFEVLPAVFMKIHGFSKKHVCHSVVPTDDLL
jgi:hypothetical protein